MKRILAVVIVLLLALGSTWLVYSKIEQARRETAYQTAIAPFQRDLRVGMERTDVQKYLESKSIAYHVVRYGGNDADTYQIKIGEEPGSLVCEAWNVYVALEFNGAKQLREIHIKKVGTCL